MSRRALGSIRPAGKGRWRVTASVGYDPVTMTRRRIDKTIAGTKTDAERELNLLIAQQGGPSTRITLKDYLEGLWLPSVEPPRLRQKTHANYTSKINTHVLPHLGRIALSDLDPMTLDRWLIRLHASGVSQHTALHAYRILHTALRQAVKWRMLPSDPMASVEAPRIEEHQPSVWSAADVTRALTVFRDHVLEPAVVIAVATGCRRSELCALEWRDVNLEVGTIRIDKGRHEVKGGVIDEPPKTLRSRRIVSLPGFAIDTLKRWSESELSDPVVANADGSAMKPTTLSRRFTKACADAGLPPICFRDLRHTHATLALEAGADVVVVSRRLGHSTVTTTDHFYIRPGRAADERAADLIDDLLAPTRAKSNKGRVTRLRASGE